MEEKISRRERKKIQSKHAILQAAVHVFRTKGFQDTSIADIMNAADLGIGTFYNYFESKEEVLRCVLDRLVEGVNASLEEFLQQPRTSAEILEKTVMLSAELLTNNRFVLPLFLSASNLSGMPEGAIEPSADSSEFRKLFDHIILEGQQAGEFRRDIPAEVITEMFHSMFQAASFSSLPISFEENIRMKLRLVLAGMQVQREAVQENN